MIQSYNNNKFITLSPTPYQTQFFFRADMGTMTHEIKSSSYGWHRYLVGGPFMVVL